MDKLEKTIFFTKVSAIETLLTAVINDNDELRYFDFDITVVVTGDSIRLTSPKLKEWLNGK